MGPGQWTTTPNRASGTRFVERDLVAGTLMKGWEASRALRTAFQRAGSAFTASEPGAPAPSTLCVMQPLTRSLRHWPLTPGVVLRERAYRPGVLGAHSHQHATLILVLEGSFQERCDGRVIARRPGEVHVLPGGMEHTTTVAGSGARVFLVGLYADWLRSDERRLAVARPVSGAARTKPALLGRQMYDEFRTHDAAAGLAVEGLLLETLGLLLRMETDPPPHPVPAWLARVRDRLHAEFAAPPAIAELAAQAGVSPGYLHRAFRARFHCTPGEYVRRVRVEHVKHALVTSREPVARIAYAAGFGDQAHLTRCFRARAGVTPGVWRRLHGRS